MFNYGNGYSLADVAAVTNRDRTDEGMWGGGAWW